MNFSKVLGFCLAALLLTLIQSPAATGQGNPGEFDKAAFFEPGIAPVRKGAAGDITIVYFMDYQCPACRKYHSDVARALREDTGVRVIYRDTPFLGPNSDAAANAAIAASFQGRHEQMHDALMSTKGPINAAALRAAAAKAGVDWDRLQKDLERNRDKIENQIFRNVELSAAAGLQGTPAFIIGNALADGALDYEGLKGEIADARRAAGKVISRPAVASAAANADQTAPEAPEVADASAQPDLLNAAATNKAERQIPATEGSRLPPMIWWIPGIAIALAAAALWRRRRMPS